VAAVAEGFVLRLPAAAKRNDGAARKTEFLSGGVLDSDAFACDAKRPVVDADDFYFVAHSSPPINVQQAASLLMFKFS
jgi:hypothetical protein